MIECEVRENCKSYEQNKCWICEDYSLYWPENVHILCKRQIREREERKIKRKVRKQSEESRKGRRSKAKGREGENEVVKLLGEYGIGAERIPLSGALKSEKYSCDVVLDNGKRIEVKRRKSGLLLVKKLLDSGNLDCLFLGTGGDKSSWIAVMPFMKFIGLYKGADKELYNWQVVEADKSRTGIATMLKWLNEDKYSNYVFYRSDGNKANWVVIMEYAELEELKNAVK